jgi:hypothetical protein
MEEKINIAKILKDKPVNTKLYSPLYGDVYFLYIGVRNNICVLHHRFILSDFFYNGRYTAYKESEIMLFPSKDMRDWSKFAWKRGDVLISDCGSMCIFKEWASVDYTKFNGCYFDGMPNTETAKYSKVDNNIAYGYIRDIENRCGGKLNLETLEIEKQTKFKDGDIVCISGMGYLAYGIVKNIDNSSKKLEYYVLNDMSTLKLEDWLSFEDKHIQPITETQQIILFDALKKYGKAWDDKKKAIVDLKTKCKFKPFDKVLSRRCSEDYWVLNFYSHKTDYYHICIDGSSNLYCIPYNEETAHLLGTTDEWKGGEQ